MRALRHVAVWLVALAVLFAGPVATLGECLRCPPDCPMHVQRDAAQRDASAVHAHHAAPAVHAEHARHAVATADDDCHRAQPAQRDEDGPCLSGVCGHMDPSLARTLPDGVLVRPGAPTPRLAPFGVAREPVVRAAGLLPEPPTEPPRPLPA
jgi:hypothetical protein